MGDDLWLESYQRAKANGLSDTEAAKQSNLEQDKLDAARDEEADLLDKMFPKTK